ncbi:RUN and FYVE domain-containing protein 4 isoform X2 [Octodon degus]|uniref:RUN and FYVE domain-containing protein 4 n=1 Tax=Octodon degus TaxID=10160 RepID=A0A6P6DAT6_OCTDE|nr:RUN and FYVE domain-containing protein 4 isoform X2 [Octodon degus]
MAKEGVTLKVTRDLEAAVSAILQSYGNGKGPVTDTSAELHRLCGCLELLLQFEQKEQRSFLGPRKDYWDFLCTALRRQRADIKQIQFISLQDKLKTSLGKGRAFLRSCLARGQLAETLQLCLLSPELTREWYGPRSPLLCPELQGDILDSLYTLNGVTFDLDLQRPDLDGAWPMFSESHGSNASQTHRRRHRKTKESPKKREDSRSLGCPQSIWEPKEKLQLDQKERAPRTWKLLENSTASIQKEGGKEAQEENPEVEAEDRGVLPDPEGQRTERLPEEEAEKDHGQASLAPSPRETIEEATSGSRQRWEVPSILGQPWVLQDLGTKQVSISEQPQEQTEVTGVARKEEQAELPLQDMVKNLRHELWKAKAQAQQQEQLLRAQVGELQVLREQLHRCEEERAQLQAELRQKQQEAEKREAMYEEELGGQRDLIQAMKRRMLELIQRCGGLVCHACSADYKKREHCCPCCAQGGEAQVT